MSTIYSDSIKPKIMIANVGIIDASLIETALSNYGMSNVVSTSDSNKVLGMINKYKPDLLLLDLDMPIVDGTVILEYIEKNISSDNMPAIIACAEGKSEKRAKAQKYGVHAIISKPFKSAEAMIAIWDFLKKSMDSKVS